MKYRANSATHTTLLVALVLALASLGDALIYPVLSANYSSFGISLYWVGILLSVNRFVRLVANRLVAYAIQILGLRRSSIWAAAIAAISTMVYGMSHQLIILLVARIGWGIAYATLRINTMHKALAGKQQGLLLGLSGAVYELGPLLALSAGPALIGTLGISYTFIGFGVLSLGAVLLAFGLPKNIEESGKPTIARLGWPNLIEQVVFWVATLAEGGLVVMMPDLLAQTGINSIQLISLTAFYLIIRRLTGLFFSPLIGWLADRFGLKRICLLSLIGVVMALGLISAGNVELGTIGTFIMARMFSTLSPAMATQTTIQSERLLVLAVLTTWRDLGAAVGALLGLVFLKWLSTPVLFGIAACIIFIYTLGIFKNEH